MLRVKPTTIFRQNILRTYNPLPLVITTRRAFSNGNVDPHKVYSMPFKLPEEKVTQIINVASYVNRHAFLSLFKIIKSIFSKKMPDVNETVDSYQVRKAYLPFWLYDMGITANVKMTSTNNNNTNNNDNNVSGGDSKTDSERQLLGIGFDCYWPGTDWNPVSYLCLSQSLIENVDKLVPFSSDLYENMDDIEVLPFTVNPIKDLEERAPAALENLELNSSTHKNSIYTLTDANVVFNAVYPVYWPVYIAQFTDEKTKSDEPRTVVISAHSNDPPIYQYDPTKEEGIEQWINNGPWIKLDVTEPEWQVGFGQPPVMQLVKKFAKEAVGQFQYEEKVNWDDERIQPYPQYQKQNKDYLQQLFKVWAQRNMLTKFEGMDENQKTLGVGGKQKGGRLQVKTVGEIRADIENGVADELNKLERLEPLWFKDYKNNNKSF